MGNHKNYLKQISKQMQINSLQKTQS